MASLLVAITGDAEQFYKTLDDTEKATGGWQDKLKKQFLGLGNAVLAGGAAIATGAIAGLGAVLVSSTQAAMEAQQVEAQLDAVLKSTGSVAGVTREQVLGLADSLSQVTTFEDDAILSGENMLLMFTNIGKDIFPEATQTMLDMSQALGQDLGASAIQLGKALNDPILGMSALRKVGVNFSEAQAEMIKQMVESGDVMGAQKFILAELQTEFGGSAKAAGETFAGKLTILKNRLGNVQETIGGALLPILGTLVDKVLVPAMPIVELMGKAFGELFAIFTGFNPDTLDFFRELLFSFGLSADQVDSLEGFMRDLADTIQTGLAMAIQFVNEHAAEFKGALEGIGVVLAAAGIAAGIVAIGGAIAALANPIGLLIAAAALLGAAWESNWGGIRDKLTEFWTKTAQPVLSQLVDWLQKNVPVAIKALADFWTGTLKPAMEKVWQFITTTLIPLWQELIRWLAEHIPVALQTLADFWTNTLQPALKVVWEFIQNTLIPLLSKLAKEYLVGVRRAVSDVVNAWNMMGSAMSAVKRWVDESVIPAFQKLAEFFSGTVGPALNTFKVTYLDPILNAFGKLGETIQNIIKWLGDLVSGIGNIQLPGWLGGGTGGGVQQSVSIPGVSAFDSARLAGGGSNSVAVNVDAQVASQIDLEDLAWRVSEIVGRRMLTQIA